MTDFTEQLPIYYADVHLSEEMPIFQVGDHYVCPINKFLLEALYNRISSDLQKNVTKFKQNKDKAFERKVYEVFKSFFPEKTKLFVNYSVDGSSENDLLVGYGNSWLVVEIKNTGFRPPMRDPLRAFDKIKTDFDKAVQFLLFEELAASRHLDEHTGGRRKRVTDVEV